MKTSVSMDASDQKKTRMKLKKFLTRRPTYQAVRDKGYIKGISDGFRYSYKLTVCEYVSLFEYLAADRQRVFAKIPRSGVWLQSDQPVPAGEHVGAQLRQNVHRPRGEHG